MIRDLDNHDLSSQLAGLDAKPYVTADAAEVLNANSTILLLTIPKSGTTWTRYLLVNYSRLLEDPSSPAVRYEELADYSFRRDTVAKAKSSDLPTKAVFAAYGYHHLSYMHPWRRRLDTSVWNHCGPKICIYRNPLDFIVSSYYFYFENRDSRRNEASRPADILEPYLMMWILVYRFFLEKVVPAGRATLLSYEQMRADPRAAMEGVLGFLGVPIVHETLQTAIQASTQANVAAQEDRRGQSLIRRLDRGRFVRDGRVGQWREHLDERDVSRAKQIFRDAGLDLERLMSETAHCEVE